jgi:NADH-quinone oxidoreductase subunit F
MLEILTDITEGKGQKGDIDLLEETGMVMSEAALCGLGKSAANPVLSTIKYFRDEYSSHLNGKTCPAGVCPHLTSFFILKDKCKACGLCKKSCPVSGGEPRSGRTSAAGSAISNGAPAGQAIINKGSPPNKTKPYIINNKLCVKCGSCRNTCPFDAVVSKGHKTEGRAI